MSDVFELANIVRIMLDSPSIPYQSLVLKLPFKENNVAVNAPDYSISLVAFYLALVDIESVVELSVFSLVLHIDASILEDSGDI